MSKPSSPPPAKLIMSVFSASRDVMEESIAILSESFGSIDYLSSILAFDQTDYYNREFGSPLIRRFITFQPLVECERLPEIKIQTNRIEQEGHDQQERRRVNIDPGYLVAERLVLATGKNYSHRVYLEKGIYADLTLIFSRKSFQSLPWSYPDYCSEPILGIMNRIRTRYLRQLKG